MGSEDDQQRRRIVRFVDDARRRTSKMGRRKKPFVDKNASATYALLPTRTTDASASAPGNTWVRTDQNHELEPFADRSDEEPDPKERNKVSQGPVDLSDLGLPNDGYDYSKHIRAGHFSERGEISPGSVSPDACTRVYLTPTTRIDSTSSQVFEEEATQSEDILEILESLDTAEEFEDSIEELQDDIIHLAGGTSATTAHTEMSEIVHKTNELWLSTCDERLLSTNRARRIACKNGDGDTKQSEQWHSTEFTKVMTSYDDDNIGASVSGVVTLQVQEDSEKKLRCLIDKERLIAEREISPEIHASEGLSQKAHNKVCSTIKEHSWNYQAYDCESILSLHDNHAHLPKILRGRTPTQTIDQRPIEDDTPSKSRTQAQEYMNDVNLAQDMNFDWRCETSRKGETPQQKKERKAAVKLGRRQARSLKKCLKEGYQSIKRNMGTHSTRGGLCASISVRKLE